MTTVSHEVFISHSSKDKPAADRVCEALEESGTTCWMAPRDIRPGQPYGEAIVDAITECTVMVLLLSENANHSHQVVREVERAVNGEMPIIPLRLEDLELTKSLEYFLSTCQWLDAIDGDVQQHLADLTEAVNTTLRNVYDNETLQFGGGTRTRGPLLNSGSRKPNQPARRFDDVILAEAVDTETPKPPANRPAGRPAAPHVAHLNQTPYAPPQAASHPVGQPTERPKGSNTCGVVGLTTSLLSVFTCFALSPIGMLVSMIGLLWAPRGSALTGTIFGTLGTVIFGTMFCYGFWGGFMTEVNMQAAADQIQTYSSVSGEMPDDLTGDELIADEADGWSQPLRYTRFDDGFEIRSAGLDGVFDTTDDHTVLR